MKYHCFPSLMWIVFKSSFEKELTNVFNYSKDESRTITFKAKKKYKEIISTLPEFEKEDRFKMNIISAAMLSAFILNLPKRPDVETLTLYYRNAMMTKLMKKFCQIKGKNKFTKQDIEYMKKTEHFKAADRNPYSWNMEFYPYPDNSGYEARFTYCGICTLTKKLNIYDLTPAMCHLDYTMSEAGGSSEFIRKYTLATGGPYCDCGYKKKGISILKQN